MSPDEKFIAYTVSANDIEKDRWTYQVWMLAVGSGEAVPMTSIESSASSPRWSPDGD